MLPKPRDFQQYALDQLKINSSNRILLSAPTGAGKAILLMMIASEALNSNKNVLLLVDRLTLIDQLSATARDCGLFPNIIYGKKEINNNSNFTIGSIQTLFRKGRSVKNYDLILIDEAHTLYKELTLYLKSFMGRAIGVTATPFTAGLGNVYNSLINCTTAQELTQKGILVPLLPYTFRKINMDGAAIVAGEWSSNDIQHRSREIYGDVVETYKKCVMGLRSICFCANIAHCEEVAQKFTENNIGVGVFTGATTEKERKRLLEDFDNKKILILISVVALAKGFDKSYVQCILDLRPLRRSLSEYIQMVGRGLRQGKDKKECYLLDFTGNIDRFLPDFENVYYNGVNSLDKNEELNRVRKDNEAKNATECPLCDNLYMNQKCMKCGYESGELKSTSILTTTENVELQGVKIYSESLAPPPIKEENKREVTNKVKPNFIYKIKSYLGKI